MHEVKEIILYEVRFNSNEVRMLITSHLNDSSLLEIFDLYKITVYIEGIPDMRLRLKDI